MGVSGRDGGNGWERGEIVMGEREREREMVVVLKEEFEAQHPVIQEDQKQEHNKDQGKNGKKRRMNKKGDQKGGCYDQWRLLRYSELPEYMKENEYILGHYRSEWPLSRAFLSLFSWHNETINVWTHLLGFFLFLGLTLRHLDSIPQLPDFLGYLRWSSTSPSPSSPSSCNHSNISNLNPSIINLETAATAATTTTETITETQWPFFVFLSGAMLCLLTSSACHLLCCHSRRLNLLLARLDYVGIAVMIVASFFPPIYYIFQCDPHWRLAYLAAISLMGASTVATLLSPHLSTGAFRSYRTLLFVGMGLSGVVPAVHAAAANWSDPRRPVTLAWEVGMAAAYLAGTGVYLARVPEKWRPGWFDVAGHSHQIFHVFVVVGALAHYGAALVLLERRSVIGC